MGFTFAAAARPAMASTLPNWLMLDRFVFWSENFAFPKDAASTLASGTHSMDQKFRICFKLVEPPEVSRLYLQMEEGLWQSHSFDIVATHRAALLLQMSYPIQVPGMPLSLRNLTKLDLDPLLFKFGNKAAAWKGGLMAKSGRLVLLKSGLTSLAIYMMTVHKLPAWVLKRMVQICRSWLWNGETNSKGGNCRVVGILYAVRNT